MELDSELKLFDYPEAWEEYWDEMPEYQQNDATPHSSITVHFLSYEHRIAFLDLMEEHRARKKNIWYPKQQIKSPRKPFIKGIEVEKNRYPIYIISKGRSESRLTSKALENLGIPYRIVIEPQEYDLYAQHIDKEKILVLPFSNLGQGSIPARNWVWQHSKEAGAYRHWILDDNIDGFYKLNNNKKTPIVDENPFVACEIFSDKYNNVAISGLQYQWFAPAREKMPPFRLNTRVYSCILIRNNIEFRWRGKYNEDTDLCLRALKAGYATVLFNAFLCDKKTTMLMKGGNTDELYANDGRLQMAQSLVDQHPDVTTVSWKWGRYQHHVDYKPFKDNPLSVPQ
jgi:hypothetical protein